MTIIKFDSVVLIAQVNFGANSASVLGLILAASALFLLVYSKSCGVTIRRYHDNLFYIAGLLGGFTLVFQGWRLDPLLQLSQIFLAILTIYYTWESIQLRRSNRQ